MTQTVVEAQDVAARLEALRAGVRAGIARCGPFTDDQLAALMRIEQGLGRLLAELADDVDDVFTDDDELGGSEARRTAT